MKRRHFLQIPMVAAAFTANARTHDQERPSKGFKVEAGKDHY